MSARRDIQHAPDKLAIKAATDALICAVGGTVRGAGFARPDQRRLSDYTLANTDTFVPADAIADLEKVAPRTAAWPQVTRELARQAGFTLVALPDRCGDAGESLNACAARHAKEASDVTARILVAASGGRLTAKKVRELGLERECIEAMEEAAQLLAIVRAIQGDA